MAKMLIKNIKGLFQTGENLPHYKKGEQMDHDNMIENEFLAIEDDEIIAYGREEDSVAFIDWRDLEVINAEGRRARPTICEFLAHADIGTAIEQVCVDRIGGLHCQ